MNTLRFLAIVAVFASIVLAHDIYSGEFGRCLCWDEKAGNWCGPEHQDGRWYHQCKDYVRDVAMRSVWAVAAITIAILAMLIYAIYLILCRCLLRWAYKGPAVTPCGLKLPKIMALIGFAMICVAIIPAGTGYQRFDSSIRTLSGLVYNNADTIDNVVTEAIQIDDTMYNFNSLKHNLHETKRISHKIHKDEETSDNGMGATILAVVALNILVSLFGMGVVYFRLHRCFQVISIFFIGIMFICSAVMFIPFNTLYVVSETGCVNMNVVNKTTTDVIAHYGGCNTNYRLGALKSVMDQGLAKDVERLCVDAHLNSLCTRDFTCPFQCSNVTRSSPSAQLKETFDMMYASVLTHGECTADHQDVKNCSIAQCSLSCTDKDLKASATYAMASFQDFYDTYSKLIPAANKVSTCAFVADAMPTVQSELCGDLKHGSQSAAAATGLATAGLFVLLMAVLFAPRPESDDLRYAAVPMNESAQPIVYGTVIQQPQEEPLYPTKTV